MPLSALEVAHLGHVMAKAMKPLGTHSSVYAVDLANGDVLYDDDATIPRNPASVEKLYTLTTVLAYFGTDGTLSTEVYTTGSVDSHGVLARRPLPARRRRSDVRRRRVHQGQLRRHRHDRRHGLRSA